MNYYEKIIQEKRNAKEVIQDGYRIIVKPEGNGYALRVLDERGHVIHERGHFSSESMALEEGKTKAKRDLQKKEWDELHHSKEEKDNANFHYLGKTFSVTSGNFQQVRQQVQKAYWDKVKELEKKLHSAEGAEEQRIEKELREIREGYKETMEEFDRFDNSNEEKGYYAKLAEEKVDKKNSKSWRIEFLGNSYYIAKPADVDLALGKARQVLYIKERELHDEIMYAKESFAKFGKELSQIEKEVYQEFGK